MSDLDIVASPAARAADLLQVPLRAGEPIDRRMLNDVMCSAFGGGDAHGHWTQRASFEVLEQATVRYLRERPYPLAAMADA